MLTTACFLEKIYNNRRNVDGSALNLRRLGDPLPDPRGITFTYYNKLCRVRC